MTADANWRSPPVLEGGLMRTYPEGACSILGRLIDFEDPILRKWETVIADEHRTHIPLCFVGFDDSRGFDERSNAEEVLAHLVSRMPRSPENTALVAQLRGLIDEARRPVEKGQLSLFAEVA